MKKISVTSTANATAATQIISAVHATHLLLNGRDAVFNGKPGGGFIDDYIHPLSADLISSEGACGSYAVTLCRLLNEMGYQTRFAQMKVNGNYGGHIIVEARINQNWAVLDPMYDLHFTKPNGGLASYADVSAHWQWYSKQVPAEYNRSYSYEGVRYTNWNKVPVLFPMIKKTISLFCSTETVEHISLRNYFIQKYYVIANILLLLFVPLNLVLFKKLFKPEGKKQSYKLFSSALNISLP